jgi:hypothetical protein
MPTTDKAADAPAKLSTESVRVIVNRWSREGFFRVPNLGDRINVHDVQPRASHTVRLWSEYEERTVGRSSRPYHGGPVDARGTPPGAWDLEVLRPTDYEDRTEKLPVPHTEQVETCSTCNGVGQVDCATCHGWGNVNCPFCQGRGYQDRMVTRTETGPNGMPETRTESVRENCTSCNGGKVRCNACAGRGKVQCSPCAGAGRVVTFDQLTVRFHQDERSEVLTAADVPKDLLGAASGKVRVVEDGERIETFPAVLPAVDEAAHTLLRKSQAVAGDRRLLFQRLRIEEMGVQEVLYTYGGGPVRRLWIFGDEARVHAPGAPWSRLRLGLVVGIPAAVVAILLVLFLFVMR